ncbi:MAG TPA: hypothetical protein VM580_31775, partial [Labilithrix sp.]|nr:hypothetical protein [Labilithrix sp.]
MGEFDRCGRIWLVDDSPLEAEMARRALSPTHDVEVYVDGAFALERLAGSTLPDAIILDWELPG